MPKIEWQFFPDENKFVETCRHEVPTSWLVYAKGQGGRQRFAGSCYVPDQGHQWHPLEEPGITGPRLFLRWEIMRNSQYPRAFRLEIPGGWLVFMDFEEEYSTPQLVFCPDTTHTWQS